MDGKMAALLDKQEEQVGGLERMTQNVPVKKWRKKDRDAYEANVAKELEAEEETYDETEFTKEN